MRRPFRLVGTAIASCATVLIVTTQLGCSTSRDARLLTQAELAALDVITPQIQSALDAFPNRDDRKRSDALGVLLQLQPLPSAARERMRQMFSGANEWVREYGPKVLAYHHVGSTDDVAAIEALTAAETVERLKTQHQAVLSYLRTPAPPLSVLADGSALDGLIRDGLLSAIQTKERSLWSSVMSSRGPDGVKVQGSVSARLEDLPEMLEVGGGEVILGWNWEASFSDDAAKVTRDSAFSTEITYNRENTTPRVAPVGASLYVNRAISFGDSALPAGSVLVRSDFGWSRVETATAVQLLDARLRSGAEIGYPVPATAPDAAIGIAALGPESKSLLPSLIALGTDSKTLVYRLRAVARIHDASVIPALQEWKVALKDQSGLLEAVDKTIAQIQR